MSAGGIAAVAAALATLAAGSAGASAASGPPPFAWRGIVEGAYGRPWTHPERTRMLRWMAGHGLNAYVHAPKDDPRQRAYWREAYPRAEMRAYAAEVRLARRLGVAWIPNLSPALPAIPSGTRPGRPASRDLCFSCRGDLSAVVRRFAPFARAGARTFMASFDDVRPVFTHPEDRARYGAGESAHGRATGEFLSRLRIALRRLVPGARLLTVLAHYAGTADGAYLRALRARLAPGIEVMWTGTSIPSRQWSAAQARAYGRLVGRRPLVWENWTNTDAAGSAAPGGTVRIFLGPYVRRADVRGAVGGFFFNPANEPDLNVLPLATAAAWLRDPVRYRPRAAWLRAVRELAGPNAVARDALRAWAETSYSTKLDDAEAPTFARAARALLRAYRSGDRWRDPWARAAGELAAVRDAPRRFGPRAAVRRLVAQAGPFVGAAARGARVGRAALGLLSAERPALSVGGDPRAGLTGRVAPPAPAAAAAVRQRLDAASTQWAAERRLTFGWRGGTAVDFPPFRVPPNVMDVFVARARALDAAWRPVAARAASRVSLSLDGRPVPTSAGGRFTLRRTACGRVLRATDGAGGRTALRLPRC